MTFRAGVERMRSEFSRRIFFHAEASSRGPGSKTVYFFTFSGILDTFGVGGWTGC